MEETASIIQIDGVEAPTPYDFAPTYSDYDSEGSSRSETAVLNREIVRTNLQSHAFYWRYRANHTIKCTLPSSVAREQSAVMALVDTETTTPVRTPPKSQIEKRIDELEARGGGTISLGTLESYTYLSDSSIEYNGLTYTVEKDSAGLISKISDSDGAEFEPESGDEITDVGFHNAVLTAVALLCGLPKPAPDDTLTAMVQYRYNLDSYTVDGTTINWLNQAGGEATMFTLVGATIVDGGVNLKGSSTSKGTMAYTGSATAYTIYLVVNANGGHRILETHGNSSYSTAVCLWGDTGVYRATAYLNGSEIKSAISSSTRAVIAVATQADGTYSMYINGELVGTNSGGVDLTAGNICLTYSNQWGNSSGDFYYYDFALGEPARLRVDDVWQHCDSHIVCTLFVVQHNKITPFKVIISCTVQKVKQVKKQCAKRAESMRNALLT